ncbi:MAG: UbiA prenyltransferase family protein [Cyclobacteriaceae bacterium]|nr:UbiA prenyltransferase family protein [Cyclobacteriaceae bacterium]
MNRPLAYLQLVRPTQWSKNFFLFIPAFFGLKFLSPGVFLDLMLGWIAFSCLASAVYVINDYRDVASDRLHPTKARRPLASGQVSRNEALMLCVLLIVTSIAITATLEKNFTVIIAFYFAVNIGYTFFFKDHAIIDVLIISSGFLLRVLGGAALADVTPSKWLLVMSFLLSLFIAFSKRRDDVLLRDKSGIKVRKSIDGYNLAFIDLAMVFIASITAVSYILYSVSPDVSLQFNTEYFYVTSLFVVIGILRYFQLTIVRGVTSDPTAILTRDGFTIVNLICWCLTCFFFIYYG